MLVAKHEQKVLNRNSYALCDTYQLIGVKMKMHFQRVNKYWYLLHAVPWHIATTWVLAKHDNKICPSVWNCLRKIVVAQRCLPSRAPVLTHTPQKSTDTMHSCRPPPPPLPLPIQRHMADRQPTHTWHTPDTYPTHTRHTPDTYPTHTRIIDILLGLDVSLIFYWDWTYHWDFIGFRCMIDILLVYKYHWYFIGCIRIIDILLGLGVSLLL